MIKNIIWDFDGTLFDTYTAQTALLSNIAFEKYGIKINNETIRGLTSQSLSYALVELSRIVEVDVEMFKRHFIEGYSNLSLDNEYPYQFTKMICSEIINSGGKNLINTHRGKERLTLLLKKYQMLDFFCDMITCEDSFPRKPDPASFNALIDRNNIIKEETLVIGDRELDILGGKNAGMKTFFFNSNRLDESKIDSDFKAESLRTVVDLIG